MGIVEFLRSVEWMCHSKMRGLMENDRPYEAADEIERLRETLHRISLGSQNSGTTKEGLGAEARKALKEKE